MAADLKAGTSAAPSDPVQRSLIWWMTFPGLEDQPGRVRQELADVLREHPDLVDILLVTSELCTNALLHTRSGYQGGTFGVEVTAIGEESLMVAVTDEGASTGPRLLTPVPTETHFRGLQVVKGLSLDYGVDGDAQGRTVWALFAPFRRAVPCPDEPC
jgi:anti-sigma regulatory factor (Ser/Thr protein kinase)